ncbi:helix-turn-helix domain-containing protein [Tetragenococcus halophilus]|nr:helix-turn-helix domain-containing protein [Tetragenococcus halophilus]
MQGNISSAAKELFMHRNTLQYKVDKFQEQTKTNLKKMDDLFLCYLLILTFNK